MPLYVLKNITQSYGEREVLNIESLEINPQVSYALQGHNGAGKSTLMKILAFLDTPFSGEISFQGEKLTLLNQAKLRQKVVWVSQSPVMYTGTLEYNIEYPFCLKKISAKIYKPKVKKLLEKVGLLSLAKAPAHRLSGGETQRASIARALATGAKVILFDEPTANVDYKARREIIDVLENLKSDPLLTMLITTHDDDLAQKLCQKRIFLKDGKLKSNHDINLTLEAFLDNQGNIVLKNKENLVIFSREYQLVAIIKEDDKVFLKFFLIDLKKEIEVLLADQKSLSLVNDFNLKTKCTFII